MYNNVIIYCKCYIVQITVKFEPDFRQKIGSVLKSTAGNTYSVLDCQHNKTKHKNVWVCKYKIGAG